jgi:hypothetical protein
VIGDLLAAGDLDAVASWLRAERATEVAKYPKILAGLERGSQDRQQLAHVVATFLLVTGEHDLARAALLLGLPPDEKRDVLETCTLHDDPEECYEFIEPAAEGGRSYAIAPMAPGPTGLPSRGALRVARIEGASVYGLTFLPVTADRKAARKWFVHNAIAVDRLRLLDDARMIPVATFNSLMGKFTDVDKFGEAVLLGDSQNIGHWLMNHLGRLAPIAGTKLEKLPLVVGENIGERQLECLERFGYPESRLIRIGKGKLSRFDLLWAPMMPFCSEGWSPAVLSFLRERFGVRDRPRSGRGRRLYLTRKGARWRRLINEDAISALLTQWGFEEVDPGAYSIAGQLALAADAEAIVGVVGAGMNLFMLAPSQTKVIELNYRRQDLEEMNVLPIFASSLGQPYETVLGIPNPSPEVHHLNYDFTLTPERLKRALNRMGIAKQA